MSYTHPNSACNKLIERSKALPKCFPEEDDSHGTKTKDAVVDLAPWDEYAFNMALEINPERAETLRQWRDDQLNKAIDAYNIEATEKNRGYARSHPHFGALPGDIQDANWRRARGVLRICWVCTEYPEAGRASGAQSSIPKDTPLLKHFRDSLEDVVIPASKAHDRNWYEHTHDFPMRFHLERGKNSGLRVRFLTYSRSLLLDGQNDLDDLFRPPEVAANVAAKEELKFWLIYHPLQETNPPDEGMLRRAYWRLSSDHRIDDMYGTSSQTASIAANSMLYCGVGGLEGTALAAPLDNDCPYKLNWANTDHYWGGDVWLAWITTLFQRSACELLARDTARLGPSLFKGETPEYFDRVTGLSNYWKTVIELESKWIYREFSRSTDVDRIYRNFQEIFDIGEMWTDIREQTELIASYADAERAKKISNIQTLGGFFFASLVLSTSFLGINGIKLPEEYYWQNLGTSFWTIVVLWAILVTTFVVVGYWSIVTSRSSIASWLRKLYLAPISIPYNSSECFNGTSHSRSFQFTLAKLCPILNLARKWIILLIGLFVCGALAFLVPKYFINFFSLLF